MRKPNVTDEQLARAAAPRDPDLRALEARQIHNVQMPPEPADAPYEARFTFFLEGFDL